MVGSGIGGLATLEREHTVLMERGAGKVSPFVIPMMISNIASGMISMEYGFGGTEHGHRDGLCDVEPQHW